MSNGKGLVSNIPSETSYPALQLHIDGEWLEIERRRTVRILNPATDAYLGDLPLADSSDLDRSLGAAQEAFLLWRNSPPEKRSAVLTGAATLIRARLDQIATIATLEEGKTLAEARVEAQRTASLFDFYAGEAFRTYGRVLVRPVGQRALVKRDPVGPVAAFSPWNFPIGNAGRKLAAPIAAGCSVILKPAEETPGSAIEVLRALLDAGLPAGVAQLVFGLPDEVSRHLIASPIIRKVSFTGSTAVGRNLLKLCADTVKRTTMELGGHAPVIVFDDANLEKAVDALVIAKFRNAGQVCVAPTRFFVQEGVYEHFLTCFAQRSSGLKVGNGRDPSNDMGPMANARRPEAMQVMVSDAVKLGASILTGGERQGGVGHFWQPTLLSNVPLSAKVMNEEPFGPVVAASPFRTFDEAVEYANRLPFGLAAYAFTENGRRANLISDALECGMVGLNTTAIAAADAPFQGVKQSGFGSEEGQEGLEACLVTKTIHQA